ncbi:hypothetical protein A8C32_16385 [Flavivirga aquatica]|uniref:Fibronectin type-III domain-containing protein n=1 Tax=Flavivirga aquatica TaxID=1849968 RepID=A0A1E5T9H5_9FLAO|nr:fibronectin type III domain-containing protein [Flavivirga aquatica]OEK08033.1 hypothetical protein A8C32_16385 [Flavivirga aquatica]
MTKILIFIGLGLLLFSCGGGDSSEGTKNNVPSSPALMDPTNNLLCIDNDLTFTWGASADQDGDAIKYLLEIATDNQFAEIAHSFGDLNATTKAVLLEKGKAFYWRVKAKDKEGESDYSNVYQLYTEGEGEVNHLPFSPTLVTPVNDENVSNTSVVLAWGARDVDTDDVLTYDVYLDSNASPTTQLLINHSSKNYTVSLVAGTTYYWKVIVKDDKGGKTIGQVWSFSVN